MDRPLFAEMRESGIRGLLVYCADYRCSHWIAVSGTNGRYVRLSDIEPCFVCRDGGKRAPTVRPDFSSNPQPTAAMMDYLSFARDGQFFWNKTISAASVPPVDV